LKHLASNQSHTLSPRTSASSHSINSPSTSHPETPNLVPNAQHAGHCVSDIAFEGESSMSAHTHYAARFLRDTVENRPFMDVSSRINSTISNLHDIMNSKNSHANSPGVMFPNARILPEGASVHDLPLPPLDVVFTCLRMVDGKYTSRRLSA
jgi:hypothetical protein